MRSANDRLARRPRTPDPCVVRRRRNRLLRGARTGRRGNETTVRAHLGGKNVPGRAAGEPRETARARAGCLPRQQSLREGSSIGIQMHISM